MNLGAFSQLLFLGAIWGASFMFMRVAAPEFGVTSLMMLRCIGAVFVLAIPLILRKNAGQLIKNWPHMLMLGVFNTAIPYSLFGYAALHIEAGFSAIINATVPFFGVFLTVLWLNEKMGVNQIIGMLVGFLGVFIVIYKPDLFSQMSHILAILACLGASACYAFSTTYSKKYTTEMDSYAVATGSQLFAFLVLLPFGLYFWPSESISSEAWGALAIITVICTGLAMVVFYGLIRQIGAVRVMMVAYLIPVFGVVFGAIFLKESITLNMALGGVIVLFGVAIANGAVKFGKTEST